MGRRGGVKVLVGCILKMGAALDANMSVAPRAGNGKVTVADILSRNRAIGDLRFHSEEAKAKADPSDSLARASEYRDDGPLGESVGGGDEDGTPGQR